MTLCGFEVPIDFVRIFETPAACITARTAPPAAAVSTRPLTAPPMAQPQPMAVASAYDQKPHYYSLHRAYGDKPDPITLSPQFLSSVSTDMAEPPPPVMPRILPGSNATAAQQTAARVQQRAASDSAS